MQGFCGFVKAAQLSDFYKGPDVLKLIFHVLVSPKRGLATAGKIHS
jgi:hypothetical protein